MTPKLSNVIRLDSLPLGQTYFTPEGYLKDRPILTRTGIFEYVNPDGTVRRELRLPEDVFEPESLSSYKGKPIIITHDAGLVTKDNVHQHQIGTILTEGYRSGDDVRAEIIIHDTDEMRSAGLKELSLGYNLELDETPGEWNGVHYDAIQRNIRINHLALVREARAGDKARLNIDGRDSKNTLKGERVMSANQNNPKDTQRGDGVLSQEDFAKAIEEYKARRAQRMAPKADNEVPVEEPAVAPEVVPVEPEVPVVDNGIEEPVVAPAGSEPESVEEKVQKVRDRLAYRDANGDPENHEAAMGVIANQDEDIGILFDIIDTLLAKMAFDSEEAKTTPVVEEPVVEEPKAEPDNTHGDDADPVAEEPVVEEKPVEEPAKNDGAEEPVSEEPVSDEPAPEKPVEEEPAKDGCDDEPKADCGTMNNDSIDDIVRERIELGMLGRSLNLDGLEYMVPVEAKKAIVNAVRPGLRLDGKSDTFVNAAFELALDDVKAQREDSVPAQKKQMFNSDSAVANNGINEAESSANARQRMIERQQNKKKEEN